MTMPSRTLLRASTFAILASLACAAAFAGGACGDTVPSDQTGSTTSSSHSSSTGAGGGTTSGPSSTASSGGTGGKGAGGSGAGGSGTGGAPDCYPNPTTYLEIINACTNAQKVDLNPVLPLLQADGGLPPLP
jgi:hypothetical protein